MENYGKFPLSNYGNLEFSPQDYTILQTCPSDFPPMLEISNRTYFKIEEIGYLKL